MFARTLKLLALLATVLALAEGKKSRRPRNVFSSSQLNTQSVLWVPVIDGNCRATCKQAALTVIVGGPKKGGAPIDPPALLCGNVGYVSDMVPTEYKRDPDNLFLDEGTTRPNGTQSTGYQCTSYLQGTSPDRNTYLCACTPRKRSFYFDNIVKAHLWVGSNTSFVCPSTHFMTPYICRLATDTNVYIGHLNSQLGGFPDATGWPNNTENRMPAVVTDSTGPACLYRDASNTQQSATNSQYQRLCIVKTFNFWVYNVAPPCALGGVCSGADATCTCQYPYMCMGNTCQLPACAPDAPCGSGSSDCQCLSPATCSNGTCVVPECGLGFGCGRASSNCTCLYPNACTNNVCQPSSSTKTPCNVGDACSSGDSGSCSCSGENFCDDGVCKAKAQFTGVTSILNNQPTTPSEQWWIKDRTGTSPSSVFSGLVTNLTAEISATSPAVTSDIVNTAPFNPDSGNRINAALKLKTTLDTDMAYVAISFPAVNGSNVGIFNGLLFNDFLAATTRASMQYMWYKADWTGSPGCAAPMLRVELTNTNFTAPYKTVSLIYEPCENRSPLNKNVWYSEVIKPTTGVFWSELQAGTAKTLAQWKTYLDTNPTNYNNWVAGAVISDIGIYLGQFPDSSSSPPTPTSTPLTLGYVNNVRVKYNAYDWQWTFTG